MHITLKRIEAADYPFVLGLNQENLDFLTPMARDKLAWFSQNAAIFDIAFVDDKPAAFIIALREGLQDYDWKAYTWFAHEYERFLYIDSIVVDKSFRSMGVARYLYQRAFDYANESNAERLAAAITLEPCNEASLRFHERQGFTEVGRQIIRGGSVRISQQTAERRKQ